jgi:HptB-dependent secretion and biofilm anti anti-sigma factor
MSDISVIRLPSRFDYGYHSEFLAIYTPALANAEVSELILDFSRVEYLDSSALGMMVMLQKKSLAAGKKIKIKSATGATEEILKMANMQKMFEFI